MTDSNQIVEQDLVGIIDVTTKSTLQIPKEMITNAEVLTTGSALNLCELFQKGKCEKRECRHVHVDVCFLQSMREKHFSWMQGHHSAFQSLPSDNIYRVFNATCKEVMDVPRNQMEFTRGLFLSAEERDRRPAANSSSCKVPTACLLFLAGTCKWGEHCNQAHVNRKWLHTKNRAFQKWMVDCKATFEALGPDSLIQAYHPTFYEVVGVPRRCIQQFTRGLYQVGEKLSSLCLLYQKGRCSCGELCKQVHVSTDWMTKQRRGRGRKEAAVNGSPAQSFNSSPSNSPGCSSTASHRSLSPCLLQSPAESVKPRKLNATAQPFHPGGESIAETSSSWNFAKDSASGMGDAFTPVTPFCLAASQLFINHPEDDDFFGTEFEDVLAEIHTQPVADGLSAMLAEMTSFPVDAVYHTLDAVPSPQPTWDNDSTCVIPISYNESNGRTHDLRNLLTSHVVEMQRIIHLLERDAQNFNSGILEAANKEIHPHVFRIQEICGSFDHL